jgi:hypothetical protein
LAPECRLTGTILQRTLRDEDAGLTLRGIETAGHSWWLLAWLPLMRGGAAPSIIQAWKRIALRQPGEEDRRVLAWFTLIFAGLAGCRADWERDLEGWAMMKSEVLEELREAVRAQGQLEALQEAVLRLGRHRFGRAANRKQKAQLEAVPDLEHMKRILDRVLDAVSWTDLLATP